MASVRFHVPGQPEEHIVDYDPTAAPSVLELARDRGLPLHWRCGLGTCGTCAIRLTVVKGADAPMGNKERNVLLREGYAPAVPQTAEGWRLACQYRLRGEDVRVRC